MRVTPDNITSLEPNQVFVFGSNLAGIHRAGAAKTAHNKFGAIMGAGFGCAGNTYAIPTKDRNIDTMPIAKIKPFVDRFIKYATWMKGKDFLVTKIGCGLAGYTPEDIAPLFSGCANLENVWLPIEFINIINKHK